MKVDKFCLFGLIIFSIIGTIACDNNALSKSLDDNYKLILNGTQAWTGPKHASETSYSIFNGEISWYKIPLNVSLSSLPLSHQAIFTSPPYSNCTQFANDVYMVMDNSDKPYVRFFGLEYVCSKTLNTLRTPFTCTNLSGNVTIAVFYAVTSDSSSFTSQFSLNNDGFINPMTVISALRIDEFDSFTSDLTEILDHNTHRRNSSRVPLGFILAFLVLSMISLVLLLSVLVGWCIPVFSKGIFEENNIMNFVIWFVILFILLVIITLSARFPGWIILGFIYTLFIIGLSIAYIMSACCGGETRESNLWNNKPSKMSKCQIFVLILTSLIVILFMVLMGITYAGWSTSVYYVWDRGTNSRIIEIQPSTVTKSTLALYTYDGMSSAFNINFFLEIFTDWCGTFYNQTLTEEEKHTKIYQNYIELYQIDMTEYAIEDYKLYPTVNDFFIRALRPGIRPIASPSNTKVAVSPADARFLVLPSIPANYTTTLKGEVYDIATLLNNKQYKNEYDDGSMIIVRLAPQDYHRFHSPITGKIVNIHRGRGPIYSVNADAVLSNNHVFLNERQIVTIESTDFGTVSFIAVGATCVGSIDLFYKIGDTINKGDELGWFKYGGSTVVLLFQKGKITISDDLVYNSVVRVETLVKMGQEIGVSP